MTFARAWERQQQGVFSLISLLTTNTSCLGHRKQRKVRVSACEEGIHVGVTWTARVNPFTATPPLFFPNRPADVSARPNDTNKAAETKERNCRRGAVRAVGKKGKPGRVRGGETSGSSSLRVRPGRGDRPSAATRTKAAGGAKGWGGEHLRSNLLITCLQ